MFVGAFYVVCDHVAHLDVLQSLASASRSEHYDYARPEFSSSFTQVEYSRHPLLDYRCLYDPIPNPIVSNQLLFVTLYVFVFIVLNVRQMWQKLSELWPKIFIINQLKTLLNVAEVMC